MLGWHHRIHGVRTAALRYFNAAGATPGRGERHTPESHLIPLVPQVAAGERDHISVFGTDYPTPDGTAVRDHVHVADLADAHVLALEASDRARRMLGWEPRHRALDRIVADARAEHPGR